MFAAGLWATWAIYRAVPSSFVPDEDEGYFIAIIQAPAGASLEYTTNIAKQAEQIIMKQPEVLAVFSVARLQLQRIGAEPGPDVRAAQAVRGAAASRSQSLTRGAQPHAAGSCFGGITGALVIPVAPPSIQGAVRRSAGSSSRCSTDRAATSRIWRRSPYQLMGTRQCSRAQVTGLFSSFTANDPQLVVEIDRDRARSLGLPMREITDALPVLLGSQYVNDFDFNNRAYRVYVQADQRFRGQPVEPAAVLRARDRTARWCRSTRSCG